MAAFSRLYSAVTILLVLFFSSAWAKNIGRDGLTHHSVGPDNRVVPGVGFHLTASYATAAIRYHNHTAYNLLRVNTSEAFRELAVRLSFSDSYSPCDRRRDPWSDLKCNLDRLQRRWNKLLGRPATPDVGIIAGLLDELRKKVDDMLGSEGEIRKVVPALPNWRSLSPEDLEDAFEYVGLEMLQTYKHFPTLVYETSAVLASLNYGLCRNYTDVKACSDEEYHFPDTLVLLLSLTDFEFSASFVQTRGAYLSRLVHSRVRYDLGLANLPDSDAEDERLQFWAQVHDTIMDVAAYAYGGLDMVLVIGEDAENPELLKVVRQVLEELTPPPRLLQGFIWPQPSQQHGKIGPLYAAARGAAEFAKRRLEAPPAQRYQEPELAQEQMSMVLDL